MGSIALSLGQHLPLLGGSEAARFETEDMGPRVYHHRRGVDLVPQEFPIHHDPHVGQELSTLVTHAKDDRGKRLVHLGKPRIAILGHHRRAAAVTAHQELLACAAQLQLVAKLLGALVRGNACLLVESQQFFSVLPSKSRLARGRR